MGNAKKALEAADAFPAAFNRGRANGLVTSCYQPRPTRRHAMVVCACISIVYYPVNPSPESRRQSSFQLRTKITTRAKGTKSRVIHKHRQPAASNWRPSSQFTPISSQQHSITLSMLSRILHHHRISTRPYSQAAALLTKSNAPPAKQIPHPQQQSKKCIREQLRELLRETAQPVAVLTAFMPPSSPPTGPQSNGSPKALHHGATLSSFTSIAMDPYPLVAFALRMPSRMANTLNLAASSPSASSPTAGHIEAHMVINILSSTQSKHALVFSRPDLYPTPFTDPDITHTLTKEGLPVLEGSLGAMSCRLVGRGLPLHDLGFLTDTEDPGMEGGAMDAHWRKCESGDSGATGKGEERRPKALTKGAVASELFIAQVTRIEALASTPMLPLLYHRRQFTSCIPCPQESLS